MNTQHTPRYRGRFAPSPSGPLHFGSLIAAVGSYLHARWNNGQWLVRIEDIDTPRCVTGADTDILNTLETFGLHWDVSVIWQSQRHNAYHEALETLKQQGLTYPCVCTRKAIKQAGNFYQGTCRHQSPDPTLAAAIRIRNTAQVNTFHDLLQGDITVDPAFAAEDFIVHRKDGLYAYQLVVVLDDIAQQISHVVRGADLIDPTVHQISLFTMLEQPVPQWLHLPLASQKPGFKLSKQNHAPALDVSDTVRLLHQALCFLGIKPPATSDFSGPEALLQWAVTQTEYRTFTAQREIVL